jgi:hypothetical protein
MCFLSPWQQFLLAILSLSVLVFKRSREHPKRPLTVSRKGASGGPVSMRV